MILLSFLGLFPALLGLIAEPPAEQQVVRRMVVRDEIIARDSRTPTFPKSCSSPA